MPNAVEPAPARHATSMSRTPGGIGSALPKAWRRTCSTSRPMCSQRRACRVRSGSRPISTASSSTRLPARDEERLPRSGFHVADRVRLSDIFSHRVAVLISVFAKTISCPGVPRERGDGQ
ncbi:hypothetical protein CHELA41_22950 [Hyphomicrobiales bacterium]|nr:hypothetical protein CHELA41_22950 [Hyphomicrobiales bacterium]